MASNPTYCGNVPLTCCASGFPTSLHFTLSAPGCAAVDGKVVSLTFDRVASLTLLWKGVISGGACDGYIVEAGIGPACTWFIQAWMLANYPGSSTCFLLAGQHIASCPIVSETFNTFTWNSTNCPCCGGGSTLTGTLTP